MNKKGFTLLELLVVVLIIGILASIALPQYQMAVTKAKVASILPLMRRWKDALQEYKLQHGDYDAPDASYLGVNWPSDWKKFGTNNLCGNSKICSNDYWFACGYTEEGQVYCSTTKNGEFSINIYQSDSYFEDARDKITCNSDDGGEGVKVCKAIGSKVIYEDDFEVVYQL